MIEPLPAAIAVLPIERLHDLFHRPVGGHPTFLDVWKVHAAILALLAVVEPDGAPERFDRAEHLRAKAIHAGHPIAVEAPDQIVADEAFKLLPAAIDPV